MGKEITYSDLPTECLLRILSFLALPEITVLLRTSKLWNLIITINEQLLYHQIANDLSEISAPFGSLSGALDGWLSREAREVRGWKEYCRLYVTTERRWRGKERPYSTRDAFGSIQRTRVGWVKIDIEKALLVMTAAGDEESDGDDRIVVTVHCLRDPTRKTLFCLNQTPPFARVELSRGFVVFSSERAVSDSFEVWRWAEDQATSQTLRQPTREQSQKYEHAVLSAGIDESPFRGELLPMSLLRQPGELRAYQLVYPTLCVGSHAGDQLWLWDVRTGRLFQTIHIEPSPYQQFSMRYVDINESHVFVATHTVSVYSRTTSECVFHLKESELRRLADYVTPPVPTYGSGSAFQEYALPGYHDPDINVTPPYILDIVVAVRASPTGDNCVVVTHWGYILLISGFKPEISEHGHNYNPASIGIDLAYKKRVESLSVLSNIRISLARTKGIVHRLAYDGRRILVFGSSGLALINLDRKGGPANNFEISFSERTLAKLSPFPARSMHLVPPFAGEVDIYQGCTCLQMTADSCWMVWSPEGYESLVGDPQFNSTKTVGMIDFTRAALD